MPATGRHGCSARPRRCRSSRIAPGSAMMFIGFKLITTSSSWFSTSIRVRTMPRSGFDRERRRFEHRDPDAQHVARPNRVQPAQLVDAGRGEARLLRQKIVGEQPHHHRRRYASRWRSGRRNGRAPPPRGRHACPAGRSGGQSRGSRPRRPGSRRIRRRRRGCSPRNSGLRPTSGIVRVNRASQSHQGRA